MSFLNNGANPSSRATPKVQPRDDRDSAFSNDLLQSVSSVDNVPAPPSPYTSERLSSSLSNSSTFGSAGPTPPDKCTNVIASGAKWQGNLTVEDSVRIDGTFAGEIEAKGTVHVADGAQVDAKVRAAYVVISGEFRGEIRCDQRTELLPRSKVTGEVITKVLSVHEGATLDGKVQMSGNLEERRPSSSRSSRAADSEPAVISERRERVANGVSASRTIRDDDDE